MHVPSINARPQEPMRAQEQPRGVAPIELFLVGIGMWTIGFGVLRYWAHFF